MKSNQSKGSCLKIVLVVVTMLLIAAGVIYFINNKPNNITNEEIKILNNSDIQNILGADNAVFCIDNIEKSEDEYTITAYMLKKESRSITKEEYKKLLNNEEIEFRNLKWEKDSNPAIELDNGIVIKADNKQLLVIYDNEEEIGTVENLAGAKTGGLRDYEKNAIKFKVSKDVLIGKMVYAEFRYDNNGVIKVYNDEEEIKDFKGITIDELLQESKSKTGSYVECKAYVKNGNVDAIQIFAD